MIEVKISGGEGKGSRINQHPETQADRRVEAIVRLNRNSRLARTYSVQCEGIAGDRGCHYRRVGACRDEGQRIALRILKK